MLLCWKGIAADEKLQEKVKLSVSASDSNPPVLAFFTSRLRSDCTPCTHQPRPKFQCKLAEKEALH